MRGRRERRTLECVSNDEDTGGRLTAEGQVQELVERAAHILRKSLAIDEAALALYRRRGFVDGEAFADYVRSPFNQFLHLVIAGQA